MVEFIQIFRGWDPTAGVSRDGDRWLIISSGFGNGCGGASTTLRFLNISGTSSGWVVEAITQVQGDGSLLNCIGFSKEGPR